MLKLQVQWDMHKSTSEVEAYTKELPYCLQMLASVGFFGRAAAG